MAVKGLSEKQKAALAEIVTAETLFDIEEYIRPEFCNKSESRELFTSDVHLNSLRKTHCSGWSWKVEGDKSTTLL